MEITRTRTFVIPQIPATEPTWSGHTCENIVAQRYQGLVLHRSHDSLSIRPFGDQFSISIATGYMYNTTGDLRNRYCALRPAQSTTKDDHQLTVPSAQTHFKSLPVKLCHERTISNQFRMGNGILLIYLLRDKLEIWRRKSTWLFSTQTTNNSRIAVQPSNETKTRQPNFYLST